MRRAILRIWSVSERTGWGRSTIYGRIKEGLWTHPVLLGENSVGWPDDEVSELNDARIAGKTDDEIRELVRQLEAARPGSFPTSKPDDNPNLVNARAEFYRKVRAGEELAPRDQRRRVADQGSAKS